MNRIWLGISLFFMALSAHSQTGAVQGFATQGGVPAKTSGLSSTNTLQGVIPGATITVYLHGTTNLATIYKDSNNTPLSNPFAANALTATNPGGWIFWAPTSQSLDIVGSGGICPNCYAAPTSLAVAVYPSSAASGDAPGGSNGQVQWNNEGVLDGASGFTTDGTHTATGAGSTVDGGIPNFGPYTYSGKAIQVLSETYTGPDFETGQSIHLTLAPASSAGSNGASGITSLLELADGPNWQSGNSFSGLLNVNESDVNMPNTAPGGINGSVNIAIVNGTAEHSGLVGAINEVLGYNTGTIDNAVGSENIVIELADAEIQSAQPVQASYTGISGVADEVDNIYVSTPVGTVGTDYGLLIGPQGGAGVTSANGIVELGDDPNSIAGVTTFGDLVGYGVLTLAEGTDNIATAGGEGWTFACSDCDTPAYQGATCTASGDHAGAVGFAIDGGLFCFGKGQGGYPTFRGSGTYTTATSDSFTVTGATASSFCTFSPTNSTAAAAAVLGYVSSVTTNSVTIVHAATVASGGTVNIICTKN